MTAILPLKGVIFKAEKNKEEEIKHEIVRNEQSNQNISN